MVDISIETPEQVETRLVEVLKQSQCRFYDNSFAFHEFDLERFPQDTRPEAVAFIRDDVCWSQLLPDTNQENELFAIWRFHFPSGADNSGFVGWLAHHFKSRLGSGVFVICGHNSSNGGIYDYWGCPISLKQDALTLLSELGAKPIFLR